MVLFRKAKQNRGRIEKTIESSVKDALNKLSSSLRKEMNRLKDRIDNLSGKVESFRKKQA